MSMNGLSLSHHDLACPFSFATVIVAEEYIDTFPHPQGLITYLQRLCMQLNVDVVSVSLERPLTIKGSWKTIIKIDAFLKTLISTFHNAILKGAVLSEEDLSAAFSHFEEENHNSNKQPDEQTQPDVQQPVNSDNDPNNYRSHNSPCLDISKIDEDDLHPVSHDKWYFNANPRGKTIDRKNRSVSSSGKVPPEPYVILEADDDTSVKQPNISEIEKALYQVYKRETIEKYQRKSVSYAQEFGSDSGEAAVIIKEEFVSDVIGEEKVSCKESANIVEDIAEKQKSTPTDSGDGASQNKILFHKSADCARKGQAKTSRGTYVTKESDSIILEGRRRSRRQKKPQKRRFSSDEEESSAMKRKAKNKSLISSRQSSGKSIKNETRRVAKKAKLLKIPESKKKNKQKILEVVEHVGSKKSEIGSKKADGTFSLPGNKRDKRDRNISAEVEISHSQHECDQCSYATTKKAQLKAHKRRVHLTKSFKCDECNKEFGFAKDLKRHMKCHTKAENCCDVCGKMYKEERKLLEHKRIHAVDYVKPEYPCKFCEKSFSTKYVLAYHIKSEHLGMRRSFICPTCGKSFSQRNSYLQHANVHLGIKPFTCEVCGKRFSYEKSLKEHKFMHSENKLFFCPVCNKSFRQASGLGIHMKVHKATKDYVCSMCGKGFSQKQALERHERIHAGEKPYECRLCRRTFADSSVLRRHMILIHKKDPKHWREDTLFHINKKTDFFISVIGNNDSNSNENDFEQLNKRRSNPRQHQPGRQQQQIHILQEHETSKQQTDVQRKEDQCQLQLQVQQEYYGAQNEQQQLPGLSQSVQPTECTGNLVSPPVSVMAASSDSVSLVKEESTLLSLKEPPTIMVGSFSNPVSSFYDVKPYVDHVQERTFEIVATDLDTNASHQTQIESTFSTPPVNIQTTPALQMSNSLSLSTNGIESITDPQAQLSLPTQLTSSLAPASNTASFLPVTYQQRSFNYDSSNIQPMELPQIQYSAMITQQYPQTIVVLQDNLGTITYHQPTVSVSFSEDTGSQNVQLQHINQAQMSSLSSQLPSLTDLPHSMTSVSSDFDTRTMSLPSHQHPQQ